MSRPRPPFAFRSLLSPRLLGASLATGLLLAGSAALAEEEKAGNVRWISDSLTTYVRSGPTDGYRIVGTLTSGQKVELLSTQGDYSQVRGRTAAPCGFPAATCRRCPARPSGCHSWNRRWPS